MIYCQLLKKNVALVFLNFQPEENWGSKKPATTSNALMLAPNEQADTWHVEFSLDLIKFQQIWLSQVSGLNFDPKFDLMHSEIFLITSVLCFPFSIILY